MSTRTNDKYMAVGEESHFSDVRPFNGSLTSDSQIHPAPSNMNKDKALSHHGNHQVNIVGSGRGIFGDGFDGSWGTPTVDTAPPNYVHSSSSSTNGADNNSGSRGSSWSLLSPRSEVMIEASRRNSPPPPSRLPQPTTMSPPPRHLLATSASLDNSATIENSTTSFSGWDQGHMGPVASPPIIARIATGRTVHEPNNSSRSAIILFTLQRQDSHEGSQCSTPKTVSTRPTSLISATPSSNTSNTQGSSNIGIPHRPSDQSLLSSACGELLSASLQKAQEVTRESSIKLKVPTLTTTSLHKQHPPHPTHRRPIMEDSCGWLREQSLSVSKSDLVSTLITTTHVPASPRPEKDSRFNQTPLKNNDDRECTNNPQYNQRHPVYRHHSSVSSPKKKMVAVLGLEGTLIQDERRLGALSTNPHTQWATFILKRNDGTPDECVSVKYRPHIMHFIATVSKYFDIAIFSSGEQDYVDALLGVMDPSGQVFPKSRRFYRQHCTEVISPPTLGEANNSEAGKGYKRSVFAKDLKLLGRPLNEVILVDDTASSGVLQPNNLLLIPTWTGDPSDTALLQLTTNLSQNAQRNTLL